jgi:Immunity protein 8
MPVQAIRKGHFSPDIDDLSTYSPSIPGNFGFLLQLLIGPSDQKGFESFNVMVCTPDWLVQHHNQEDVIIGRHYLIVFEYNYERIIKRIDKYLQNCTGSSWVEVAQRVGRLGRWEFEDYHK